MGTLGGLAPCLALKGLAAGERGGWPCPAYAAHQSTTVATRTTNHPPPPAGKGYRRLAGTTGHPGGLSSVWRASTKDRKASRTFTNWRNSFTREKRWSPKMVKKPGPNLALVAAASEVVGAEPPGKLGAVGLSLWNDIVGSYEFNDRASYQVLFEACAASDRAASLRALIDQDGELIRSKTGVRDNPLIKHELANRAFIVRSLMRLGLDLEPLRGGPGRPPGR